jgi:tetratricopeptide (TPR) repeat protein
MHCLEKDRTRRYDTANALATDLERHLRDEPIAARPPSRVYRTGKFVRRHRLGVAAATAVLLALVAGLGFALIGFRQAVLHEHEALAQKRRAETARNQAQGLIGFVMRDLQPDMQDHGRLQSQKLTIEAAVRYFDQLPPELRDEATTRDHAAALEALADVYGRKINTVTIVAENIAVASDAAQRALALRKQLAAAHPEDPDAAAAACTAEIRFLYNTYAVDPAKFPLLEAMVPDLIGRFRELEQRFPDCPAVQRLLAAAVADWGYMTCFEWGRPAEAPAAATEARERWQRLLATAPDDMDVRVGYTRSVALLARILVATGEPVRAIDAGEEALAYATQLLESDQNNLRLLFLAAEAAGSLSRIHWKSSLPRARETERIAREHYRMLMILDPAAVEWRARCAEMHSVEVAGLVTDGRLADARAMMQDVITLLKPAARDRDAQHLLAQSFARAARLAVRAGDPAAARTEIAALDDFASARVLGTPDGTWERSAERLFWLIEQCDAVESLEDWSEVARRAREGLGMIERELRAPAARQDELRVHRAAVQTLLGRALLQQGNLDEAAAHLEQAVTGFREAPSGSSLLNQAGRAARAADLLVMARGRVSSDNLSR